jgi:uncharacterized protein YecT (DUF1311 family)
MDKPMTLFRLIQLGLTQLDLTRLDLKKRPWRMVLTVAIATPSILTAYPIPAALAETEPMPGVARPACEGETQLALNLCAGRWERTADFLRSQLYEATYLYASEATRAQLVTTEEAWNTFLNVHCEELAAPYRDGSIYPLLRHNCRAQLINDRIADLQALNAFPPPTEANTPTLNRLSALLNDPDIGPLGGQPLWQRYSALHCEFETLDLVDQRESSGQPAPDSATLVQRLEDCQNRLNQTRLRQLETFSLAR